MTGDLRDMNAFEYDGVALDPHRIRVRPYPRAGLGVHAWLMHAANVCARAGMTPEEAADFISTRMPRNEATHLLSTAAIHGGAK